MPHVLHLEFDRRPHRNMTPYATSMTPSPSHKPSSVVGPHSYPTQPSTDFTAPQRAYPPHQYAPSVNYAAPPYDFAAYPIVSDSIYQGGQYGTQPSQSTRCDHPASDAPSFHPSLYGPMGYFGPDGQRNSPPGAQHQPSLISGVRFDDMFGDY
ncbi:hypothetical protein BGW80DRAFT_1463748 [Lactifluus volemus]|nr:hypothetical protein BGW80DRAFT_1463748 [Lactifluus volemus]